MLSLASLELDAFRSIVSMVGNSALASMPDTRPVQEHAEPP